MRVLLNETLDPNGALYSWLSKDLRSLGHEVAILPVQELAPRLGVVAYQDLLVSLVRDWRPQVVLVHPPYDFIGPRTAKALRGCRARVVAFAFDDPIFLNYHRDRGRLSEVFGSLSDRFDLFTSTSQEMIAEARGNGLPRARWLRWAMATPEPWDLGCPAVLPAPSPRLLLVGRAYPRRVRLVRDLAALRVQVEVHGAGWDDLQKELPDEVEAGGFLGGEARNELQRRAPGVICPADWEDRRVPMVKARLLEVVMAGGLALAEHSPDLRSYFSEDEVLSFDSPEELAGYAKDLAAGRIDGPGMAGRAYARARREHTWRQRWPELLGLLDDVGRCPEPDRKRIPGTPWPSDGGSGQEGGGLLAYRQALAGLALDLERSRALDPALQVYRYLLSWAGEDCGAAAGIGRCLYGLGRAAEACGKLEEALASWEGILGADAAGLPLRWPAASAGLGLGRSGRLAAPIELNAYLMAALLDIGRVEEARVCLSELQDPDWLLALADLLDPSASTPEGRLFWEDLARRVFDATPCLLRSMQEELRARYQDLGRDPGDLGRPGEGTLPRGAAGSRGTLA